MTANPMDPRRSRRPGRDDADLPAAFSREFSRMAATPAPPDLTDLILARVRECSRPLEAPWLTPAMIAIAAGQVFVVLLLRTDLSATAMSLMTVCAEWGMSVWAELQATAIDISSAFGPSQWTAATALTTSYWHIAIGAVVLAGLLFIGAVYQEERYRVR